VGEAGTRGATGPIGPRGQQGPQGAIGPTGSSLNAVPAYCGMFNASCGEVDIAADEVAAMTFSDFMPIAGAWYDERHSVVITEPGVYKLDYCLRATSVTCGTIQMSITNDAIVIPGSSVYATFAPREAFSICGFTLAEVKDGAHLHFIVYSREGARFRLSDGVNLMMLAEKLADLPGTCPVEPMPL